MLHTIAKLTANLDLDVAANSIMERFYQSTRTRGSHFERRFQILSYHKVSPDAHPFFPPIHPAVFERQMQFLKSFYRVMSLQELIDRTACGDIPARSVAITFDDGYRDNYEYAFPILKKYQLPATVFVATGAIGTGEPIWHDRVFDAFRFATVDRARLKDSSIPELMLETVDARSCSLEPVLARAKTLYGGTRQSLVDDLEETLRPHLPFDRNQRMLTWDQVREMFSAGIEFGSHTVSHTILSRIPELEIVRELQHSKEELSGNLKTRISLFAYPNGKHGDFDDHTKSLVRDCGYSCAVTCCSGFNSPSSDIFALKRGLPWQTEIDVFRLKFFLQRHGLAS